MNQEEIKSRIIQIIATSQSTITADEINERLRNEIDPGRTQETIRKYIRQLVNDENNLIGSSSRGYFKIDTIEKVQTAISYLKSRIPDLQSRADNIRTTWNSQNPNNQI